MVESQVSRASLFDKLLARLKAVEERLALLEAQRPTPLPDPGWTIWSRVRANVIFHDAAGHLVTLPIALVNLLATGEPFDGVIKEQPEDVAFISALGKEIGRIPKSLAVVLHGRRLLKGWNP